MMTREYEGWQARIQRPVSSILGPRLFGGVRLMGRPSPVNIRRLDSQVIPMIVRMRNNGILVDRGYFADLTTQLQAEKQVLESRIYDMVGTRINLGSPDQVAKLLYQDLGFDTKGIGKTKSKKRLTIDDDAIGMLKPQWKELIGAIEDWRENDKLEDSYTVPIPKLVGEDGRLRTDLKLTRVSSGRISSSDPNLMAIPTRSDKGRLVRNGFVARDGCVLVATDESQIEMRVAAHYSGDANLMRIFQQNLDIHIETASRMFRLPPAQLDKYLHRYPAKRVGFGVLFGITAEGLLRQMYASGAMNWTLDQCQDLIDLWFGLYPDVKHWMDEQFTRARKFGLVWDLFGRIRPLPEIWSAFEGTVEDGHRASGSMPVSSTAQGTMKLAMAEIDDLMATYRGHGHVCEPLIQIHDDLLVEVSEEIAEDYAHKAGEIIENCVPLVIPIKQSGSIGKRWGEMEELKVAA